jgi:formylglycine-generating enzyme required for sulfatase activity
MVMKKEINSSLEIISKQLLEVGMTDGGVRLFFSYSHKDEELRDKLATHLSNLEWQGVISSWHDRKLVAGMEWDGEIKSQLDSAGIILLLISPDFIASKYCRDVEIPQAIQRHEGRTAYVVPVILRPFDWSDAPFAKLQAFPKDAKPVTTWANQDEAFVSVTQGIRTAAKIFLENQKQKLEQKGAAVRRYVQKVEEILSNGDISIIERDTLDELRDELGLTTGEAQQFEALANEPYKKYGENLDRYRQTLTKVINQDLYPFSEKVQKDLELRQRDLGLKANDVARIEQPILAKAKANYEKNLQSEEAKQRRQSELEAENLQQHEQQRKQVERQQQLEIEAENLRQLQRKQQQETDRQQQSELEAENLRQLERKQQREIERRQKQREANQQTDPQSEQQSDIGSIVDCPQSIVETQSYEFEVVAVDAQSREINRSRKQAKFFADDLGNGVLLDMVSIPRGVFSMGSPNNAPRCEKNEQPQHSVTIQPFFMGKFPVTQAQWRAVVDLPRVKIHLNSEPASFKGDSRPVERVSWYEAMEFCDRLSQKTGHNYRLPSEAEWEYACRAGTSTAFQVGEALPEALANFNSGNAVTFFTKALLNATSDVGNFKVANNFGLYDMHGNVWEWCADHWHDTYENAPSDGHAWLSDDEGQSRVLRGGSWDYNARSCRSASRIKYIPDFRLNAIGFRVVAG